jgi:hypothetical protein
MRENPPGGNDDSLNPRSLERRILELEIKWKITVGVATVLGLSLGGLLIFAVTTTKGLSDASDAVTTANRKVGEARAELETTRTNILRNVTQIEGDASKRLATSVEAALAASRDKQVSIWLADERVRRERHDAIQDRWINHIYSTAVASPESDRGANGYWQGGIRLKQSQVAAELP